jgi:dethiobiotin synthetase
MKIIVVTGTGTDVGKTITTAALAAVQLAAGRRVAVVKPVQTGTADGLADLDTVGQLTGVQDVHCYEHYAEALAPGTAAVRARQSGPSVAGIAKRIAAVADRDLVIIEGAGGVLVELNAAGETLLDLLPLLMRLADTRTIVVTPAGLGMLNHAALTERVIAAAGLSLHGFVVGSWPAQPSLAERCNLADLPRYGRAPLRGVLPERSGTLPRPAFVTRMSPALDDSLGGTFDYSQFLAQHAEVHQ